MNNSSETIQTTSDWSFSGEEFYLEDSFVDDEVLDVMADGVAGDESGKIDEVSDLVSDGVAGDESDEVSCDDSVEMDGGSDVVSDGVACDESDEVSCDESDEVSCDDSVEMDGGSDVVSDGVACDESDGETDKVAIKREGTKLVRKLLNQLVDPSVLRSSTVVRAPLLDFFTIFTFFLWSGFCATKKGRLIRNCSQQKKKSCRSNIKIINWVKKNL